VHLGIYRFYGDPDELVAAYDRLAAAMPVSSDFHLCVRRAEGITIYDTCPSQEVFERFSRSRGFLGALAAAGLPAPEIQGLPVHASRG
jgi:hypothetical protein